MLQKKRMTPTISIKYFMHGIVSLQFAKTTLLAWHYFWQGEIRSDTFWTDLVLLVFLTKSIFNRKI